MSIIICPGIHSPELTQSFIQSTQNIIGTREHLILPTERYLPYCAIAITQWLKQHYPSPVNAPPLSFVAFSAGVVGGIGAAWVWQLQGGKVRNFVAFDGWGMPLVANFPIYRVSHDYFTHWSSAILGGGKLGFYAEPAIAHLDLWRSPSLGWGWQVISPGFKTRCLLTDYLGNILNLDPR